MTLLQAAALHNHDRIDYFDTFSGFVLATVIERNGTNLKIRYDGWSCKWNKLSDFTKEIHRFAVAGSISKRPAHRFQHLKVGDYVDINPALRHPRLTPGWTHGKIRKRRLGQVQVMYRWMGNIDREWCHLDNEGKIAEFKSKSEPVVVQNTPLQKSTNRPSDSNENHQNKEDTPPFRPHMTLEQASNLKVHDEIYHRDQVGRFLYATVSEKQGTNLKIRYVGWSRKWDTWSDFNAEIHRFAVAGSISKRRAHRFEHFKKGDKIDINPQSHPGWKCGEIRKLDQKSGHVQVVFESMNKNYLYWAHLDNEAEIAEFTSKSGTVRAPQVDIVEYGDNARDHGLPHRSRYRMSEKQFPRAPNERIANKYENGDSNGSESSNNAEISRKRNLSEFQNDNQIVSNNSAKRRKIRNQNGSQSTDSDLSRFNSPDSIRQEIEGFQEDANHNKKNRRCGRFEVRIQTEEQPIKYIGPRDFSSDEIFDMLSENRWTLIVFLRKKEQNQRTTC